MTRNKDWFSIDDDESVLLKFGFKAEEYKTRENLLSIKNAMEKLPDMECLVLKLHIYYGLEIGDIALYIHKTKGATSAIKSRAIARLRELLKKD